MWANRGLAFVKLKILTQTTQTQTTQT